MVDSKCLVISVFLNLMGLEYCSIAVRTLILLFDFFSQKGLILELKVFLIIEKKILKIGKRIRSIKKHLNRKGEYFYKYFFLSKNLKEN